MKVDHAAFDRGLLESLRGGRLEEAATSALKAYGSEIYALLAGLHHEMRDADDVFSLFCEQLWKSLPRFEGRSSFRTWTYTLAWRASSRFRAKEKARREVLMSDSEFAALALRVRTTTQTRLRRERHGRLRQLRDTLPAEDQILVVLRIERELDWKDIARVMSPEVELDEDALARESARLRKRFQALKTRLRAMIRERARSPLD